jgi:acetylornithine deacetylase
MSPDFYDLFDRLIREHSVSSANPQLDCSNLGVIHLLAERFSSLGFQCEIIPVTGLHPKANLIATLGSGPGGLVLSGHTDTVPFDADLWQSDPLRMTRKNDRLYGLGSTDMKGFFAVVHEAVKTFSKAALRQPLIVLATADEESSMEGARLLTELGRPKGRYAVIGEPTGLKPVVRHKGIMMETIRIMGRSGHSSNPALGRNALEAMHEVIDQLLKFRHALQKKHHNPHFEIQVPTLNLGVIHGGDNPNRICGHCRLEFDLRLLPGMDNDATREQIRELIRPIGETRQVEIVLEPLFTGINPFDNQHGELAAVASRLTGHSPQSVAFGTEGPFLQQLGMDTIIMGPGSIDLAHQPNEYLDLSQVPPGIEVLRQLIRHCCV